MPEDRQYRLLQARLDQYKSENDNLRQQLGQLLELLERNVPGLIEREQIQADNETMANKVNTDSQGVYSPM